MAYAIHCRISFNISAGILHSVKTFAAFKLGKRKERIILKDSFAAGNPLTEAFSSHAGQDPWKGLGVQKLLQEAVLLQPTSIIGINNCYHINIRNYWIETNHTTTRWSLTIKDSVIIFFKGWRCKPYFSHIPLPAILFGLLRMPQVLWKRPVHPLHFPKSSGGDLSILFTLCLCLVLGHTFKNVPCSVSEVR